jgi:hypothetical protein
MAKSIATAFSYEGSISPVNDDENIVEPISKHRQQQGVPSNVQENKNNTWANRVRGNLIPASAVKPFAQSSRLQHSPDLISDLASSRAEVAELKTQISELTANFATQRTELIAFFKDEMARNLSDQLKIITEQQHQPSIQETSRIDHVVDLIQRQDIKFQALTDMVASMMTAAVTTHPGKRNPDEVYDSDRPASPGAQPLEKRQDSKHTPSKQLFRMETDCTQQSPSQSDHQLGANQLLSLPVAGGAPSLNIMINGPLPTEMDSPLENPYQQGACSEPRQNENAHQSTELHSLQIAQQQWNQL